MQDKKFQGSTERSNSPDRRTFLMGAALAAGAVAAAGGLAPTSCEGAQEQTTSPEDSIRGSERLLERLGGKGATYSPEALNQIVGVAKKHNLKILNWCQFGQPAVDGVCGTFQLRPELAGSVLVDLIRLDSAIRLRFDVFPLGIPALDAVRLNFGAGRVPAGGIVTNG